MFCWWYILDWREENRKERYSFNCPNWCFRTVALQQIFFATIFFPFLVLYALFCYCISCILRRNTGKTWVDLPITGLNVSRKDDSQNGLYHCTLFGEQFEMFAVVQQIKRNNSQPIYSVCLRIFVFCFSNGFTCFIWLRKKVAIQLHFM